MYIEIKPVENKDIRWAVAREFELLPEVDPAFSPANMGGFRRMLLKHIVLPANYRRYLKGWIAWDGSERVGFLFARKGPVSVYIESLGVLPDHQRQGIGTKLVEAALEYTRDMELNINGAGITRENDAARAFLDKLGFSAYRAEQFVAEVDLLKVDPLEEKVLRELSVREIVPTYEKWLLKALQAGDAALEVVIWEEHRRMALKTTARHWTIREDEEEVGYLRISGLTSEMTAYIVCSEAYWGSDRQWAWIREALDTYPFPPNTLFIEAASTAQFRESADMYAKIGFRTDKKGRFLLFKQLDR